MSVPSALEMARRTLTTGSTRWFGRTPDAHEVLDRYGHRLVEVRIVDGLPVAMADHGGTLEHEDPTDPGGRRLFEE